MERQKLPVLLTASLVAGSGLLGGRVFARGEAGDEIVGLENEADGVAPKLRERRLVERREIGAAIEQGAARRRIESAELVSA